MRIDSHVSAGYQIPRYYDSMIAKLIVTGADRAEAIRTAKRALAEVKVQGPGIATTVPLHQRIPRARRLRQRQRRHRLAGEVPGGLMRIVVTGGAGFVGSHLCERLLDDGHEVVAVDNLVTGDRANVAALERPGFTFVEADISVAIPVDGPLDRIYNLACPASPIDYQRIPVETMLVCAHGTRNGLELARATGARFLQASTSECYGDPEVHPQVEDYWGNVNPIGPRSCYDEGKRYAEALCMAYHRAYGTATRMVRIFNTYGPRMRLDDGRVVPALVGAALTGEQLVIHGDGSQTRSFCYVADLVDGIVRLMESDHHEPVNIGNPTEMTIREFADTVLAVTGVEGAIGFGPRPVDDPEKRRPDISKARALLGWEPTTPLAEGLRLSMPDFAARLGAGEQD